MFVRVRIALIMFSFQFLFFRCVVAIIDENSFPRQPDILLTYGALYGNKLRLDDCSATLALVTDDEWKQQYHCCEEFSPDSLRFRTPVIMLPIEYCKFKYTFPFLLDNGRL